MDIPNASINVLLDPLNALRILGRDAKNNELDLKLSIDPDPSKSSLGDVYTLDLPIATVATAAAVGMDVVTVDKYSGVLDAINLEVTQVSPTTGRPAHLK